ncbi:unnamed protein product [Rotaria sp. Silwood1]|nr:unnamed protein product [Rotaria sp. Silwood1]
MLKTKPTSILKKKNDDVDQIDSDISFDKYYQDDDLMSSSSSTTSKSSPTGLLAPKRMFIKRPTIKKDELKSGDEMKLASSDDNDPLKSEIKRPLNPLTKPDKQYSLVGDSLGSTMPGENETPLSTMKFGSDTLDEEQEKAEFFRNFEKTNGEKKIDYGILNQQIELDLSPTRNGTVINSFDKQINQMSTPLHHQPNNNTVKGNH